MLAVSLLAACEERVPPTPGRDVVIDQASPPEDVASPEDAVSPAEDATDVTVTVRDAMASDGAVQCRPNNDGVIDSDEFPYVLGAQVLYQVNDDATTVTGIQTAPTDMGMGPRWDFAAIVPSDRRVLDEVYSPAGRWWQMFYPSASFALPANRAASLHGVYRRTPDALQLLASVSRDMNRSNVVFMPAVDTVRFPLREGSTWTITSSGNGILDGIGTSTSNVFRFLVDRRGTVFTPANRFDVLRLRMDLEQTVTGTIIRRTQRTYLYLAECWGLVARVVSVDNETASEFTRASEYRRLGL